MAFSTFQKVTLATCLVLCVALLLPRMLLSRGSRDAAERPDGHFPPMVHRRVAPEGRGQRAAAAGFSRAHSSEPAARAKGAGTGAGTGGKSNLAGQIIPVYGFGILLYILYILFKITSKGNSKPAEGRFPPVRSENMKRKITDFELAQLHDRLRETELVMENIVSSAQHSPDRVRGVTADQEESLLQQLTEITRVMQEGQLVEGVPPEPRLPEDWEDYPEEAEPFWERSRCQCQHAPEEGGADEGSRGNQDQGSPAHPGPPEDPPAAAAAPEDLELTLTVRAVLEQEPGGPGQPAGAEASASGPEASASGPEASASGPEASSGPVRRRGRRRGAKKAAR